MSDRPFNELRPYRIDIDWTAAPAASVLIACGRTRVLCTASIEKELPPHRIDRGGWLTAEYAMLPGCSPRRIRRPGAKPDGRATEIQRLVGRSIRAGFDLDKLGPRALWIDCDVIEADGGTRTTAITGGYLAARIAVERLIHDGLVERDVLLPAVAAVSVGIVADKPCLDLDYILDSNADVDMNVVMNDAGDIIEVQGTGEKRAMSRSELDVLLDLAAGGISQCFDLQMEALARALTARPGLASR